MDPANRMGIEEKLRARAQELSTQPLIPEPRATEYREGIARAARREAVVRTRRAWACTVLGAAAALVLLFFVPEPLARYGRSEVQVAFLDTAGRVLDEGATTRSEGAQTAVTFAAFLLELVAIEDSFVAVRIGRDLDWHPLAVSELETGSVELAAGEEWLREIPWPSPGEDLIVVLSREPIPAERLNSQLKRMGTAGIEMELGCRVILRRFGPDISGE
jgi:hypothetical protein